MGRAVTAPPVRVPARWHPLVLVSLALAFWVYHPITRAYFFADDFVHLASIENDGVATFVLSPFGGHNFLVRNVVFLAWWKLFGLHASFYHWTALLTHLLNVFLLFGILRTLTRSALIACFGSVLWGTTPLAVGTIGWYSMYGQALLTAMFLVILDRLVRLAAAGETPSARTACAWYVLLLAGTTCFGTGLGVAVAFPVVLFLLLPSAWNRPLLRVAYLLLPLATAAVYLTLRQIAVRLGAFPIEDVRQQQVILSGLWAMPAIFGHLVAYAVAGTTLGLFFPAAYPSTASWVAVAAFAAGTAYLHWQGDWSQRRTAVAMAALGLGVYFLIAAGRSGLYAILLKIPAVRVAAMTRYHYVGTIPVVIILGLIVQQLARLPGLRSIPGGLALTAFLALVAYGSVHVKFPMLDYHWCRDYVEDTAREMVAEVHEQPPGATVYLENKESPGTLLGPLIPDEYFPGRAAVFLIMHPGDALDGRTVRFIERRPEVIAHYRDRPNSRLARLLVDSAGDSSKQ